MLLNQELTLAGSRTLIPWSLNLLTVALLHRNLPGLFPFTTRKSRRRDSRAPISEGCQLWQGAEPSSWPWVSSIASCSCHPSAMPDLLA